MSNQAIVIKEAGKASIEDCSIPQLRDDYILVEPRAVALNPTDWKHIEYLADPGARVGCDYAGVVLEVGKGVKKGFKKGDRVAGFSHGGNAVHHEDGAFQSKVLTAKGDIQMAIPDSLSFEEAATLGVGIITVGQGLYQSLKLPLPNEPAREKFPLLIYGGSTATGSLAIQFAKLSGLQPIVTCSEHNFKYCESLGADKCFDYRSSSCAADIKKYTNDSLKYVLDCISEGDSPKISVESMSSEGGVYSTLLPVPDDKVKEINSKVENKSTLGYTVVGESFKFGNMEIAAKPEDLKFGITFSDLATGLLEQGKVKVHTPAINEGGKKGLEGCMDGMKLLKEGKVSGKKLVYTF